MPAAARTGRRLRLYAHRGASALLPENSLAAFRRALDDGASALEMDVQRSSDGHFVVSHDADGRRTAGIPDRIADTTLAALKRWRLGAELRVPPEGSQTIEIATLSEVLEAFPGVPLSVELKSPDPRQVDPLLALLAAHGGESRVTLASFHDAQVLRIRRRGWQGRTALSRLEVLWLLVAPLTAWCSLIAGHAAQIPRRVGPLRLDGARLLERCRRLGLRADYWVVNDPAEASELFARGASGVMTDNPAHVLPALAGLPGLAPAG
jgi:glycerophosphoryl diester phosphodiesterase